MYVPAGKHTIDMSFDPKSIHITEGIAYAGQILIILGIAGIIYAEQKKRRKSAQ